MGVVAVRAVKQPIGQPYVVLAEDDERLARELGIALAVALPTLEVARVSNVDDALELVRDPHSRLLVTEADTLDGVALATCARLSHPALPVIFLGGAYGRTRVHTASFADAHALPKPCAPERVAKLAARLLDAVPGFRGELHSRGLLELVQLVALSMPTGALHVWSEEGRGSLFLEGGSIVHAACRELVGVRAFEHMSRWTSGGFSLEPDVTGDARSIELTTTELLLDHARILDEERVSPEQSGTLLVLRSAAEHFERGLALVHALRYDEALAEWERAATLEPDHRVYQHNLRRLRERLAAARRASGGSE